MGVLCVDWFSCGGVKFCRIEKRGLDEFGGGNRFNNGYMDFFYFLWLRKG